MTFSRTHRGNVFKTFYQTVRVAKTLSTLECRPFAAGQTQTE